MDSPNLPRLRQLIEEPSFGVTLVPGFFDQAPDAIVISTPDGTIVAANRLAEILLGYTREQLIGQPIEMLVPEALRMAHEGHRKDYTASPHVRRMGEGLDLHVKCRSGALLPVDIMLGPLTLGDQLMVVSVIREITNGNSRVE